MNLCKKCIAENVEGAACGQGFREWTCAKCGKEMIHHNTHVPKVCHGCSLKYNLCEECGASIEDEGEECEKQ